MGSATCERCQGASERTGALYELKRAGHHTWVVEVRSQVGEEPPLRLLFSGPKAYEEALEFLSSV